eukprot:CAMPEP_0183384476 /NCGR_PEP_ID=MMETSP0370-20130417/605_1 /TAXON_ID=268820 /ORGANISM="Peridinium aciculiferum, Strain PAER-2" /LENGTH=51 /DNA_ID=CAMNT_0025562253 /DNA_START=43 /DNA_END=195 /DNA_ORIENTATION=-
MHTSTPCTRRGRVEAATANTERAASKMRRGGGVRVSRDALGKRIKRFPHVK